MIVLETKLDDKFIGLPELNPYLGKNVIITINDVNDLNNLDKNLYNIDEESLWLKAISNNPAFDFLFHESENIYSIDDGEPINV